MLPASESTLVGADGGVRYGGKMRALRLLVILLACCSPVFAQTSSQHGIQTGDLDKKCDPCTDFAQYANGTWHAQNPIPAYMDRWSRRWKAGEEAKNQLKVILEENGLF